MITGSDNNGISSSALKGNSSENDLQHERYMREALLLASEAAKNGEVPVGCIITDKTGKIIGAGRNRCEKNCDPTAHAEIEAIRSACAKQHDWRLEGCTLYVTLEPCPMCMGAIINSRIPEIVFAVRDPQTGACGSVTDLLFENYHHRAKVFTGVLAEESKNLLQRFFLKKR